MEKRIDILRWYKRAGSEPEELGVSYSATMRKIRKENPDSVLVFMKSFKAAFDAAAQDELDDPEKLALMEAKKVTGLK